METQKIINLLNDSEKLNSKFETRKWYIINDQNNGQYGRGNKNEDDSTIKYETKVATGDIKVAGIAADTNVVFKNCAPFTIYAKHTNDEHIETSDNLDIIMPIYNLIEYSDNYADFSLSLYQFNRDESPMKNAGNPLNVALDNSTSFKYKAKLLEKATDADGNNRSLKKCKKCSAFKILGEWEALGDQWHGIASCKSHKCCTVRSR